MPFKWTNSATGKVEGDDKSTSIFKEIKTNIQSIYTALGIGTVTYTQTMSNSLIRQADITELRSKIDHAHNNRSICKTVNSSHYPNNDSSYYGGYDSSYNSGYDGSNYGSNNSKYNSSDDSSQNATYNGGYYGTHMSTAVRSY